MFLFLKEDELEPLLAEEFIEKWLKNDNGTLATYMKETEAEDEDLVKGREALSETLGMWMEYTLRKGDAALFEESYVLLQRYFLEKNGFVYWKLTEEGESEVAANALVDDLRIIHALLQASEKWGESKYEETAVLIGEFIAKSNQNQKVLTDFYDREYRYATPVLTLSYIEPEALKEMVECQVLDQEVYENMIRILMEAKSDGGVFQKSYNIQNQKYSYDEQINMIDQALVALYRTKSGFPTREFTKFIKEEMDKYEVVFGQYNRATREPSVKYESPAAYGWLILYSLEIGEAELAKNLFKEMNKFQQTNFKYKGGYSVYNENTHIFDNIVPLLAERELRDRHLYIK
ncbi:glycosyl hydrolase family 8 [Peribacillus asahii]|uniref:glycosyl hydrolase family 8 n=1 Tax=Peribacillus asahii TaxID=228899 RepID=UPI0037F75F08